MAKFSKLFPFIQISGGHFPPMGEPLNPREVSPDVSLVHELLKCDTKHAIKLRFSGVATVPAVGANALSLNLAIPVGRVFLPYTTTFFQNADVSPPVLLQVGTDATVETNLNPVLLWSAAAQIATINVNASRFTRLCCVPWVAGINPTVSWTSVGGGIAQLQVFGVEVPLETFDWSTWAGAFAQPDRIA